jgi:DHA2 family multidrug resistance protein
MGAEPKAAAGSAPGLGSNRGLITMSVMLASFLQTLDTTIASVALPHIQGSVSSTPDQISWVLTSYIVAAAITIPLSGWLANRYGRKKILVASVVGFTLASALCGVADSLWQIVAFRFLQGVCGAALAPQSQAVLLDINPPERHGRAMAMWAMALTVAPALGPVIGGWLTDNYSWRWVFYINVLPGILCAVGILAFLRESERRSSSFDFLGFATLSVAVGVLQLMLDRGQTQDWFNSTEICLEAAATALAFYIFIAHTLTTTRAPFVRPVLFRDRNFVAGSVLVFLIGIVMFAGLTLLPPLLQDLLGYPVTLAGVATAPRGLGGFVAMLLVGGLISRFDARLLIGLGLLLTAVSLWQMCEFSPQMDARVVMFSGFLNGMGIALAYAPLATLCFATLGAPLRSEGTSIFNLLRNIGNSIGISVVQALFVRNIQIAHASLSEHLSVYGEHSYLSARLGMTTPARIAGLNAIVTRQAEWIAYLDDFKLLLILTLGCLPLLLFLKSVRRDTGSPGSIAVE